MFTQTARVEEALRRIKGEFVEMPGLRLTTAQAQRLWGMEADFCEAILGALVDAKFLMRSGDVFVRVDPGPRRMVRTHRPVQLGSVA
ncbi:MAG: hypothetical protein M3R55_09110 [Acidobacteriota bacterium]|nr:hypothetical protein [Acidobacteriota bacterium]